MITAFQGATCNSCRAREEGKVIILWKNSDDLWPKYREGRGGLESRMGPYPEEAGSQMEPLCNVAVAVLGLP